MKKQATSHRTPPSATDLMALIEEGKEDEVLAIIQNLNQLDFIRLLKSVQQLDTALSNYALSWQKAEYWGRGEEFPALAKAA